MTLDLSSLECEHQDRDLVPAPREPAEDLEDIIRGGGHEDDQMGRERVAISAPPRRGCGVT